MDILPLLCIVSVAFTGLTKGAGLLPDGPLNAAVGETVMFNTTLTPTGNKFSSVGWQFGVINIITISDTNSTAPEYEGRITLFMTTGSLELRNVALSDSGGYSVIILPQGGIFQTGSTRLEVYEPVSNVIATASSTDMLEFNSSVRLSCSSSGSSLSFIWMNGSSEVTASDRVQLTGGGANLTIVNVTRYDQGPFRCHVSNPVSNGISDPVNLSISYGPERTHLTISPSQQYFAEGSNIILSCSADSRPAAIFNWILNGSKLPDTGAELRLMNINMNQSGNYSCQAFNQKTLRYETSQPSTVSVLEKISSASVTQSSNLTTEGNSVNLTCDAAGSIFKREWMKDGSDLILDDNIKLYEENRVLAFQPLKKTDTGEYSCNVSNPVSSVKTTFIMVVNYGPEKVKITGPSEIHLGQPFTLKCHADSVPSASYLWTLNETEIHNSPVFTKDFSNFSDSGNYTCEAMNKITGLTKRAAHKLSVAVQVITEKPSGCSAGCIAGIVIAVLVICGAAAGGGYYFYRKKNYTNRSSRRNTTTRTRGEGQDNTGYSSSQELNYADVSFFQNKEGGRVHMQLQNDTSDYAQVRVNNNSSAASSPPSYDAHLQRTKRQAPQPDANGTETYAQVRKT